MEKTYQMRVEYRHRRVSRVTINGLEVPTDKYDIVGGQVKLKHSAAETSSWIEKAFRENKIAKGENKWVKVKI